MKRNSRSKIFAIEHIPGYQAGCWNILIFGTVPLWHVCPSQLFHVRFSTCTRHHLFHSLTGIFLCDHHKRPEGRKNCSNALRFLRRIKKSERLQASKKIRSDDSYFHHFYRGIPFFAKSNENQYDFLKLIWRFDIFWITLSIKKYNILKIHTSSKRQGVTEFNKIRAIDIKYITS